MIRSRPTNSRAERNAVYRGDALGRGYRGGAAADSKPPTSDQVKMALRKVKDPS